MTGKRTGIHVGTSGWSYGHWSGVFYPEDIKPARYLEYYLTRFDCVELNSSFYHLPRESTIKGWMERTPESFRFCPKLSRFITHQKRLAESQEALHKYFGLFQDMKLRMGPVLIQLPPGLKYDRSLATDFFDLLKSQYHQYRFAIEIRHGSWIQDGFFQLLSDCGISFVMADSGSRFPYHEAITADFVYMRFHGPDKLYASGYAESALYKYAEKIINWLNEELAVWVFFNNDFGGFAIKNALTLREMVETS
jgi:uncharacterized protein YecE (DUF72 family)